MQLVLEEETDGNVDQPEERRAQAEQEDEDAKIEQDANADGNRK